MAVLVRRELLAPGGMRATTIRSSQQWDMRRDYEALGFGWTNGVARALLEDDTFRTGVP
jgi:neutral trehalase